jgi:hypothetical protein
MAITRTAMIDDDGSGTTGTILNNAWKQELYGQIDGVVPAWVDIPFNAAVFTATAGATWTVTAAQQATFARQVYGKAQILWLTLMGGTVAGTPPAFLYVQLGGLPGIPAPRAVGTAFHYWGVASGTGIAEVLATGNTINLLRDLGGTPWTPGAYNIRLQISIPM